MSRRVSATVESWPIAGEFRIARGSKRQAVVVVVRIDDGGVFGWGEGVPYPHFGESADGVKAAVLTMANAIDAGLSRRGLIDVMPAGAARNAIDCALWDLECQQSRAPVWQLAGLAEPGLLVSTYTLAIVSVEATEGAAHAHHQRPWLKVKLGADDDAARISAVRRGAPAARLVVDVNEGWSLADYRAITPLLSKLDVAMIEQPLPPSDDAVLETEPRPIPTCADESFRDISTLPSIARRYDAVNLKLDKLGGLTAGLRAIERVRDLGLGLMVGCHVCTSLSLAPAMLLARDAAVVDLDAAMLLGRDRSDGVCYQQSVMSPSPPLWGVPR